MGNQLIYTHTLSHHNGMEETNMQKKLRKKRVAGERCSHCQSTQTYFRIKSNEWMCRGCGKTFTPKKENHG